MRFPMTSLRSLGLFAASLLLLVGLSACGSTESASSAASESAESAAPAIERPSWNVSEGTYRLRLAPETGAMYVNETNQSTTTNMVVQGNEFDVNQDQTTTQTIRIADYTAEGVTTLATTIDRIQLTSGGGGGSVDYDSADSTASGPVASTIGPMIGQTLEMQLDQTGSFVGSRDSLSAQIDALMGESGGTGDMLIDPLLNQFRFYPSEPVAVGDSWSNEVEVTMGAPFTVNATYTLSDVTDGLATLDVRMDLSADGTSMNMGQMQGQAFLSGTQSGTLTVDLASGMVQSRDISGTVSGFVELTPPGGQGTQELDMEVSTDVSSQTTRQDAMSPAASE